MQERPVNAATAVTTGGSLPGIFADDSVFAPTATFVHGVHRVNAPANQRVQEIRILYRDRLGLADGTTAYLDGNPVGDDERIRAGMTLTFMHRAGEKGERPR